MRKKPITTIPLAISQFDPGTSPASGPVGGTGTLDEVAMILAKGLIRLACRRAVPNELPTPVNLNNLPESGPNCLEVDSETRLHGLRG